MLTRGMGMRWVSRPLCIQRMSGRLFRLAIAGLCMRLCTRLSGAVGQGMAVTNRAVTNATMAIARANIIAAKKTARQRHHWRARRIARSRQVL